MGKLQVALRKLIEGPKVGQRGFVWPYPSQAFDSFTYGGQTFFGVATSGSMGPSYEAPPTGFAQMVEGPFRSNAVVFACELKRMSIFSQARFIFQAFDKGRPGRPFALPELDILEHPWPRGSTHDLLANMLLYADIGGNAFVARTLSQPDRLRVLRPDWVTIVMGDSSGHPVESASQLDAEIIGFIYDPKDGKTESEPLLVEEVAHWAPIPDPLARFRGMSWMTPVIREVQGDQAATMHKLAFFEQGATPQMVVTLDASVTETQFSKFVAKMDDAHAGWRNAYKTIYLGGGAVPTVVGKDLQQLDFSATQGKGETRIAAASGVHPVLVPLSEAMQGSSLNAGNYQAARRSTADTTFHPLWQHVSGCLATIVPPPNHGSRLWYDEAFIPFLREDARDAAEILQTNVSTITQLVREGFTPKSSMMAVAAQDVTLLVHTGLVSVQLQPMLAPVADQPAPPELVAVGTGNGGGP